MKKILLRYGTQPLFHINWGMRQSFIILALYSNMLNLVALPGTFGVRANVILPMLVGNILFITLCLRQFCWVKRSSYGNWFLFFTFFLILNLFYTWLAYPGEPALNAVKTFSTFTVLFTYFIFLKAAQEDLQAFLHMIIDLSSVLAALFLAQGIAYNVKGIQFLSIYGFNYGNIFLDYRNGYIRLIASDLVDFAAVLSVGCIWSETILPNHKKRYWLNLLLVLLYEGFVGQTRAMLLIIIGVCLMSSLFMKRRNTAWKIVMVCLTVAGGILLSGDMLRMVSKFLSSVTMRTDYSMYHRIDAYLYYLNVMLQKPLFGTGMLRANPLLPENYILVTGGSQFAYSDVGIAGVAGKLGLPGIVFYVIPIWKSWRRYVVSGKKDRMNFVLCWGMIFATLSLSLFDAERMIVLAVYMAVSDVSRQNCLERLNDSGQPGLVKEEGGNRHDGYSGSACNCCTELSGL